MGKNRDKAFLVKKLGNGEGFLTKEWEWIIFAIEGSHMPSTAIDTMKFAQELEKAGYTRQQAEAQANALNAAINESIATKQDLKELELRLTIRIGGIIAACTALLLAALPLLIK